MPHVPDRWLQGQLVIYHHPLDSVLESKQLKNWTLVKGSFGSGKVPAPPLGVVGEPDPSSLSFGGALVFEGLLTTGRALPFAGGIIGQATSAIALDSTRALMMWGADPEGGDPRLGVAAVMTVTSETGFTISGTNNAALHEPATARVSYIDSSLLESGATARVLVAFRFQFGATGRIKVISVTGGSLSAGSHTIFTAGNSQNVGCEALDSTTFLLAWTEASTTQSFILAGTASGFSISLGSNNNFDTLMRSTNLVKLTSTKALLVYHRATENGTGAVHARVVEVVGGSVTVGPRFDLGSTASDLGAAALSSTKVVIVQHTNGGATIATVSGTTVTFGPKFSHDFGVQAADAQIIPVSPISSSQFVAMYGAGSAVAVIGTVSGTSITFGPETTAHGASVAQVAGAVVGVPGAIPSDTNGSHIFMMYTNAPSDNKKQGRAQLSSINYDGEVTRTGGGYASTIGSTKLAYTGWMNRPSG